MSNFEIKNDLKQYGVETIASTEAQFQAELSKFIGGRETLLPLVEIARPFAFFIKNNSPKEIIGVSLRWNFVKSDGFSRSASSGNFSPGVLEGRKPRDPWRVGKTSLINSGDLRCFSYFSIVDQTVENTNKSVKYGRFSYDPPAEQIRQGIAIVENQKKWMEDFPLISVSIDGIIFNDGHFVGEDKNFSFASTNGVIQARRDFIKELRDGKLSAKDDSEILEQFVSNAQERLSFSDYVDEKDAFEKSYKVRLNYLKDEVKRRRTKFSDSFLIAEYLETQDSDFIPVRREDNQ